MKLETAWRVWGVVGRIRVYPKAHATCVDHEGLENECWQGRVVHENEFNQNWLRRSQQS